MCGRYSLALRPSQIRAYLEAEGMDVDWAPADDGDHAPRQSYNFAPGYHGLVYRANVPDWGAGPQQRKKGHGEQEGEDEGDSEEQAVAETKTSTDSEVVRYEVKTMKWGLIPFWTKRNPDYASMLRTINCRDDSLMENRGMWNTMKQRKRCIVLAQGFYEWLKKPHSKEKIPHYIKRADGKHLCMAGLWDCVSYENTGPDEKLYTYTIITTSSNKQLNFLHDRMPVILDAGSRALQSWLDPKRYTWTEELQMMLKPYQGELEIYPVSKEVGKVGNNSPTFIVPIDSSDNKNNIANFFSNSKTKVAVKKEGVKGEAKEKVDEKKIVGLREEEDHSETLGHESPENIMSSQLLKGTKRSHGEEILEEEPPVKIIKKDEKSPAKLKISSSPAKKAAKSTRSSTSNGTSHVKTLSKEKGSQKITSFFSK